MKIPDDSKLLDDPQFQSLLVLCLESLQRGEEVDHASLKREYPQFADELLQFLADRELLEKVALSFADPGGRPVQ